MTRRRILQLIPLLPGNAPFLEGGAPSPAMAGPARRYAFVEKYARSISDPAFGWHFVESFLVTRCGFPVEAFDSSLFRAFYWKRQELCFDASVTEAMSIALPRNYDTRDVLEALLLIPQLDPREICRLLTISLPALRIYTDLFFNVLDRSDEPEYIRRLVYPDTRRVLVREDYLERVPTTYLLRRVAYERGMEAVNYLAGFRSTYGTGTSAAEAAKRFATEILRAANFVLDLGGANSKAPVLQHARALVLAGKRGGREDRIQTRADLAAMGVDGAIGEHLRRASAPDPLLPATEKPGAWT